MKYSFTLLYFLLVLNVSSNAQNITGIWKGYFVQSNFGFSEDRYKFEVQVEQLPNNALNGVTYSYKTTFFYGKTEAKGIYTKKTNNILLNELKLLDLKIADHSEPCLMTCYLEYNKMGNTETLTGTYSSRNLKSTDCGSGKVYLERSAESDFYKEDFLVKREKELKKNNKKTAKKIRLKPGAEDNLVDQPVIQDKTTAKIAAPKKPVNAPKVAEKPITAPKVAEKPVTKPDKKVIPPPATVTEPKKEETASVPPPPVVKVLPTPEVIKKRDNDLVKTITTSAKEFKIELYDNGEIDGDRISVYHNNQLIVSNKLLTDKPITFTIKADENAPLHEFVMVAENLGSIPPNTALMIVTAGENRYELFVTSTEKKNAVVKVQYKK